MTLQNGMGNADIIAEFIDPEQILAGTTSHGATLLGPGSIRHAGCGPTTIGAWSQTEAGRQRAGQLAEFFSRAGIETESVADVRSVVWNKLLINIGINAITALTNIKNGQILDLEITRELSRTAVMEAINVAQAGNVEVHDDALDRVFKVAEATAAQSVIHGTGCGQPAADGNCSDQRVYCTRGQTSRSGGAGQFCLDGAD